MKLLRAPNFAPRVSVFPILSCSLALLLAGSGCSGTVDEGGGNPPTDSGSAPMDSGLPNTTVDSGTPIVDSGTPEDAGLPDAGKPDAGHPSTDAGSLIPPVITGNGYAGSIGLQKISPANYSTVALVKGKARGVGEVNGATFPFSLPAGVELVDLATGGHADMALDNLGHVWAWYGYEGDGNTSGDMGDGQLVTGNYLTPRQLLTDDTGAPFDHVRKIIPAFEGSYAIKDDGTVWAWGTNSDGQAGAPMPTGSCPWLTRQGPVSGTDLKCYATKPHQVPFPAGTNIVKVTVSTSDTPLALDDQGQIWQWGSGTLIGTNFTRHDVPVMITQVPTTHRFIDIASGIERSLALDDQGRLYGWGPNHGGAYLGVGDGVNTWAPTPVPVEVTNQNGFGSLRGQIVRIEASTYATYAFTANGDLYAWGDQTLGDVGNGSTGVSRGIGVSAPNNWNWNSAQDMVMAPVKVLDHVLEVYATYAYVAFAVTDDGKIHAWGRDKFGNLGDGCAATDAANAPDVCDVGTPKSVTPFGP